MIERGSSESCARYKNVYESRMLRVVLIKPSRRPLKLCVPWTFPTWNPWTRWWTASWFTDGGPVLVTRGQPYFGAVASLLAGLILGTASPSSVRELPPTGDNSARNGSYGESVFFGKTRRQSVCVVLESGLLSRGSKVRILPGAPFPKEFASFEVSAKNAATLAPYTATGRNLPTEILCAVSGPVLRPRQPRILIAVHSLPV